MRKGDALMLHWGASETEAVFGKPQAHQFSRDRRNADRLFRSLFFFFDNERIRIAAEVAATMLFRHWFAA